MPRMKVESFSGGNRSWLASAHAIVNNHTGTLDVSKFTKGTSLTDGHYPKGFFPSGLELNIANLGAIEPWTGASGEKLGFLFSDEATDGVSDLAVSVVWHGSINVSKLPKAHVEPQTGSDASKFDLVKEG